ncbi:MAG: HAMP domain-containing sensor histidine kinase [Candidatus Sphingomonas phytovorans]|nr:HAMP domain-containing sensor histidine kinase [Sphingomonas sp.]WEK00148.1 MAG: HAMP domain-containing sensor histidine kinase [Sphingomonas sp.]
MTTTGSLFDRHRRRTMQIGGVGAVLLLLFVVLDFELLFGGGTRKLGLPGIAHEIIDHVAVPLLVLTYPTYLFTQWLIASALRSFGDAAGRIELVDGHQRGFRVDARGLPLEAMPFVDAVNALLARLDEAAARQEMFAVDVAHELRTPLTVARLEIDRLGDPTLLRLRGDLDAMARLVDQLMMMAQLDAAIAAATAAETVDLVKVARAVIALVAPMAAMEERTLGLEVCEPVSLPGYGQVIAAALRNLVENAIRATPAGGSITVFVGPGALLRVRDEGPGLQVDQLKTLSRRYERFDHANVHGAGLGLAIVAKAMDMHGGALGTDPKRCELRLEFDS